jgi:transposase
VHGAQIKSKVLAECRQPGASVSAVALAHGLNANLVHKWLRGHGLQRARLKVDAPAQAALAATPRAAQATAVQFVAVGLSAQGQPAEPADAGVLEVELRCGANQVTVRWPATQAAQCTQWLRDLTAAVLGAEARAR